MLKTILFGLAVAGSIGAATSAGQAREFNVWGYNFTTDDASGPAALMAPVPSSNFNALAAPGRHHMRIQRLRQFEQR